MYRFGNERKHLEHLNRINFSFGTLIILTLRQSAILECLLVGLFISLSMSFFKSSMAKKSEAA